ncbi:MAG: purine-nucleoside phosphorylase [Chitinophagaceae bacterium]|nr:purine-nucleoside phosphorylase [Chitinophagaceae bacterium]
MTALMQDLNETVAYIRSKYSKEIHVGIILGSGLGNLTNDMKVEIEIPYHEIPHFPVSTVKGHQGSLVIGNIKGKTVLVMAGRFHFYEGYTTRQVTYPIRVMRLMGVSTLLLTNAAGGVQENMEVGDLMLIKDHISLFTVNPLIGPNEDALGTRFPDMSEPYSKDLILKAETIAKANDIDLKIGVYFGVTGPTFETRAEYKLIHVLGGDAVGMSTVQEAIVAKHCGMQVFAISVITDIGIREEENIITHEEVLQAAKSAEPKLTLLFSGLIESL